MRKLMKNILGRFMELQIFTGESMDYNSIRAWQASSLGKHRDIDDVYMPIITSNVILK